MKLRKSVSLECTTAQLVHAQRLLRSSIWWRFVGLAMFLAIALAPFAVAQQKGKEKNSKRDATAEREGPEFLRRRAEWFYHQRAYPLGFIPAGARLRAIEQMRSMIRARGEVLPGTRVESPERTPNVASIPTWNPIGPAPTSNPIFAPFTSGRVIALAVDPEDPTGKTAYLGAAEGGVWKTTDGGQHWTPLTDFEPSVAAASIALDASTTPTTIYVGTGEQGFIDLAISAPSYYGAGVLKSTDGGMTWQQLGASTFVGPFAPQFYPGGGARIRSLAVSPDGKDLLAAVEIFGQGSQDGIYRSTDGGNIWTNVLSGAQGTSVVFDPTPPSKAGMWTAYAALGAPTGSGANGIYKSTDGGQTWILQSLPVGNVGTVDLTIAQSSPSTLFAAVADASTFSSLLLGVFKTTKGGTNWTPLNGSPLVTGGNATGFCDAQCFYDMFIRVSPTNPMLVFAGGAAANATLIRSLDGGTTWTEVSDNRTSNNGLHVDEHAFAFSANGNMAYTGNDGGVWGTTNPTATTIPWTNLNQTLQITQFYGGLSIHPATTGIGYGGTQDNGTQGYIGTLQWVSTQTCGDGTFTAIDLQVPSTVYTDCPAFGGPTIFKSVANGTPNNLLTNPQVINWSFISTAINPFDPSAFEPPLVIDPSNSQTVYYGTYRVWATPDGGNTWAAISPDLTGVTTNFNCGASIFSAGCILTTIAVAPSSSGSIYAGSDNSQVQVTMNGGTSWTNISAGLPPRAVTQIGVDSLASSTAYVTFSGFSGFGGDTQGHVFKTTNGGQAWTDISGSGPNALPNIPVNDIVVDPDLANTLYVATDVGVFETTDGGTNWSPLGMTTLPHVAVMSLKLHRASRTLRAATHGRGVWDLELGNLPAFSLGGISPPTDKAGDTNNFTLSLTGTGFTSNSVVKFVLNGTTTLPPTATNLPTQLTVTIPSQNLAAGGLAQVSVFDSTHTPHTTNALPFTLLNSTPVVKSISPASLTAPASADVQFTVNGQALGSSSALQLVQLATTNLTVTNVNSGGTQMTSTIPKSFLAFGGTFFVIVNNPTPGGGSSNAALDPTVCCSLVVTGPVPANDNFANATNITSNTFTITEDSSGATTQGSDPTPPSPSCTFGAANGGAAKSVWFQLTTAANGNGTIEADTIGSAYDTILSVWTGTQGNLSPVACNDDIVPGINRVSQVNFGVNPSTTYYFMVSAFVGDGGKLVFNLNANLPPPPISVSVSPPSPNVAAGLTQKFTANVQNTSNTGVTWSLSGTGCSGAACGTLNSPTSNPVTYIAPANVPNPATVTITALSMADNSTAGSATITVTPNYTTMASAPSPSSVTPGGSATSTVTLTPQAGTTPGAIMLNCTTIQPATSTITCSFAPNPVNVGNSAATSTLTVNTRANSVLPPVASRRLRPLPIFAVWLAVMVLLAIVARKESRWRRFGFGLASALLLAFLFFQAACSSGGGGGGGPTPSGGTPAGTYTITVAGTPPGTGATTTVTLTVQ